MGDAGKSLLAFLLLRAKCKLSLSKLYTSFQVTRSMWLLIIHHSFRLSSCLTTSSYHWNYVRAADEVPKLKTCNATAAGAFLTSTISSGIQVTCVFWYCDERQG